MEKLYSFKAFSILIIISDDDFFYGLSESLAIDKPKCTILSGSNRKGSFGVIK